MASGILQGRFQLPINVPYTPKADCTARNYTLQRSAVTIGTSRIRPLLMIDQNFTWNVGDYENTIIPAVRKANSRNWDGDQHIGTRASGASSGIQSGDWSVIRGAAYANTIMVGIMLARLTRTDQFHADYVVSAAPNVLYNSTPPTSYTNHTAGDNKGTQIHFEMIVGQQLAALINRLVQAGFQKSTFRFDVDLLIEKPSMCDGCLGTWNNIVVPTLPGSQYRLI